MKEATPPPPSKAAAKSNKLANRRAEVELLRAADSAGLSELSPPNVPPQPTTQPEEASKPEPSGRKKVVLSLVSSKLQRTE
ncbi:hypothetical protein D3C87_1360400 [compost metagenome]